MTQWAAFLGLTGLVLTLFLGLAHLSQGTVRTLSDTAEGPDGPGDASDETTGGHEPGDTAGTDGPGDTADTDGPGDTAGTDATTDSQPGFGMNSTPGPTPDAQAEMGDHTGSDPQESGAPGSWQDPPESREELSGVADGTPSLSTGALLANVTVSQGLFGGVLVAGAFYFDVPPSALGLGGEDLSLLALGVGLGVTLWLANELAAAFADAAGVAYDEALRALLAPESTVGWVALFGVVLPVVALVEELLFRAAVIGVPAAGVGTSVWALVPVSAGAFALGHGAQGRVGIAVTGGLGLILAGAYAVTGSLLVVVVAHYLVNALEFFVHELLGVSRVWAP